MLEIATIFSIAVALSMDTFSLSLGIGTTNLSKKKILQLSTTVGIMHFLMPCIGMMIGTNILKFFEINSNFLLGLILLFIAGQMIYEIFYKENENFELNNYGIFLFSFSVSIDAFSTGLGLCAITTNLFLALMIFSAISFLFTILGLYIGKYANKILGIYASIFGSILLILIGISHLCK